MHERAVKSEQVRNKLWRTPRASNSFNGLRQLKHVKAFAMRVSAQSADYDLTPGNRHRRRVKTGAEAQPLHPFASHSIKPRAVV